MPAALQSIIRSRKFWALMSAVVAAAAGLAVNEITFWQFVQTVGAAAAVFAGTTALEDAAHKNSAQITVTSAEDDKAA